MVNLKQIKVTLSNLGVETDKVDDAIKALEELNSVLDEKEVKGKDVLDQMLGCMLGIEQIIGNDEGQNNRGRYGR